MAEKTLSEEDVAKLQALVNTLPRRVRMLELGGAEGEAPRDASPGRTRPG